MYKTNRESAMPEYRNNYRKKWEQKYGKLEEGFHLHHIIPKHAGGTDDLGNLIPVTKEEHQKLHLERYEKYGDFRDLCAYYVIGSEFEKCRKEQSSAGGKIGGKFVYDNKLGLFKDSITEEMRKKWCSEGGKIGGKKQAELGLGFHQYKHNPKLHKSWASKGGLASGTFKNKEFQSEMGKRGGVKNKGFIWINDGENSYKYTKKQQQEKSIEEFLKENTHMKKGRGRMHIKMKEDKQ